MISYLYTHFGSELKYTVKNSCNGKNIPVQRKLD